MKLTIRMLLTFANRYNERIDLIYQCSHIKHGILAAKHNTSNVLIVQSATYINLTLYGTDYLTEHELSASVTYAILTLYSTELPDDQSKKKSVTYAILTLHSTDLSIGLIS